MCLLFPDLVVPPNERLWICWAKLSPDEHTRGIIALSAMVGPEYNFNMSFSFAAFFLDEATGVVLVL